MQRAFDLSKIRITLRKAVANGLFTVEDLDTPSDGFRRNMNVDLKSFPAGYQGVKYQNLLSDDEHLFG